MNKATVIVVQADACSLDLSTQLGKLVKKHCFFPNYACGPTGVEKLNGAMNISWNKLPEALEQGGNLLVMTMSKDDFGSALPKIIEACDRKAFLLVSAQNGLCLAGNASNKSTPVQNRPCSFADVVPTLCYMFGFPVPGDCTGAVLYQGLKSPDMPHEEIRQLMHTIEHLEASIERESRNPWDKHDCA